MKGINISCSSRASTAIYTPISMDQPSSSSSSSPFPVTLLGGSTGGGGGSRLIDRHNPIIADERRISKPTPPSSSHSTPYFTPKSSPFIHQKKTPKTNSKAKKKTSVNSSTSNAKRLIGLTPKIKTNGDHDPHRQIHALKQGASQPSDLIIIKDVSKAAAVDHISPPESSRYLLDDPGQELGSGFLDRVLSDFDPVLKLKVPFDQPEISPTSAHYDEIVAAAPKSLDGCSKTSKKPPLPSSVPASDNQVVVLRVSLHCRGCEGKVRKHISRMQGVRSFNIDFAAKKVTVEGDVTPLEVLTSISKVKNAQIWTPPASAASKSMDPITQKI